MVTPPLPIPPSPWKILKIVLATTAVQVLAKKAYQAIQEKTKKD